LTGRLGSRALVSGVCATPRDAASETSAGRWHDGLPKDVMSKVGSKKAADRSMALRTVAPSLLLLGLLAGSVGRAAGGREGKGVVLVEGGRPRSAILIGQGATALEEHAAEELRDYVEKMTGARLPVRRHGSGRLSGVKEHDVVIIGRAGSNPLVRALIEAGKVRLSDDFPGLDGFIAKTVQADEDRMALVLGGSKDHSTLYAVYDVLERFGRIGFFRYEEYVPKVKTFSVPPVDIAERPYYRYRIIGGQKGYWGFHWWNEEQFRRELDWCAKKRVNADAWPALPALDGHVVDHHFWKSIGLRPPDLSERQRRIFEAAGRLGSYARMLGVRYLVWGSVGRVPPRYAEELKKRHPGVRTILSRKRKLFVHPADPFWVEMSLKRMEACMKVLGESPLYSFPNYGEDTLGDTEEQKREAVEAYGRALAEVHRRVRPKPEAWVLISWMFNDRRYWTPERTKLFFDGIPAEVPLVVWDLKAEQEPLYEYQSYWHGRKWAFVAIHSMGMFGHITGDITNLLTKTHEIVSYWRARENCVGYGSMPEQRDYSPMYFELIYKLAWDPICTDLRSFLLDYAERRYGPRAARTMLPVLRALVDTVHGPHQGPTMGSSFRDTVQLCPLYYFPIGTDFPVPMDKKQQELVMAQAYFIPVLRDALRQALEAGPLAGELKTYQRDVVDVARTILQQVFNLHTVLAFDAFRRADMDAFERHASLMLDSMEWLLKVVSVLHDRHEYCVTALLKRHREAPWGMREQQIKHHLIYVNPGAGSRIHEYYRADWYEVIRDFYRPRIQRALSALRKAMKEGKTQVPTSEIGSAIDTPAVAKRFIEGPTVPPQVAFESGTEAAKALLEWLDENQDAVPDCTRSR